METAKKKILISGASVAGLCTAHWMNKLGYQVTVVELFNGLKRGGTPVNILGDTINLVERIRICRTERPRRHQ